MDTPPAFIGWLQAWGVILSREHHESPYDTYYCITTGFWNPLLDSTRFFERVERLIRRSVPGTDPRLRSEREKPSTGDMVRFSSLMLGVVAEVGGEPFLGLSQGPTLAFGVVLCL